MKSQFMNAFCSKGSIFTQGSASKKSSIALVPLTFRPSSVWPKMFPSWKKPSQKLQQKCIAQRVLPPFPSRGSSPSKGWQFWQNHQKIRKIFGGGFGCKGMHSGLIIIYFGRVQVLCTWCRLSDWKKSNGFVTLPIQKMHHVSGKSFKFTYIYLMFALYPEHPNLHSRRDVRRD